MAKKRLIPKLQLMPSKYDDGIMSLVTTVSFNKVIEIGNPVSQAKIYEAQMVDELFFIDMSHSKGIKKEEGLLIDVLITVAQEVFLPLTIGGGVKSIQDIRLLLQNGADKVSINSHALENPDLIKEGSRIFGAQCIVASIDYKFNDKNQPFVYGRSGTLKYDINPVDWARKMKEYGAGEILLTCIDNDGKKNGLEQEVSKKVIENSTIPVIISGGCGRAAHFIEGFQVCNADAVSAGTFFCFQDQNPMQTRGHIRNAGIEIRTST